MNLSISRRMSQLAPSPTLALNAKAKAMAKQGINVINLSVGEPDFDTPKAIVDVAIAALNAGATRYGVPGGGAELRAAIAAKLLREQQLEFKATEIVAGMGAKEVLMHLAMAMLNPEDEVLIPAPYWVSYTSHCEIAGCKAVTVPMPVSLQDSPLDPDHLHNYATPRTKAIIINSPNNPGGYMASREELLQLGDYLSDKPWWIISDEIYEYLSFDDSHVSLLSLCPQLRDRFILVNGLSKGFAMTGWRVGYACGPSNLMKVVENLQSQSSTSIPGFIEAASIYALQHGAKLLAQDIAGLKRRRDAVAEQAQSIPGVSFMKPQGAFYLFLDLRARLGKRPSMDFSQYLLEEGKTAMVPGEAFGAPGFMRMSYAARPDLLKAGLDALARCLDSF